MTWLDEHWDEIVGLPTIRTRRLPCAVARCDRLSQALGLCTGHYMVARQQFDPTYREHYLASQRQRRDSVAEEDGDTPAETLERGNEAELPATHGTAQVTTADDRHD